MLRRHLVTRATLVALALAAPGFAQAPDRSSAPKPGPAPAFTPPAIQQRALGNGLPVWIDEQHDVPVVQVNLVVRAGSGADPQAKYGLASLTAAMLDEGAAGQDALAIADAVDFLGARLSTGSSFDASFVNLHVPVARLDAALAVMADVALRPNFTAQELDRLREERLTGLKQLRDNPPAIASVAFPLLVYGPSHRYGISANGTEETLRAFTPGDLRSFHTGHYRSDNAAMVVVGDVTPADVLPRLERAFGGWKAADPAPTVASVPTARQLEKRQVFLVDKPGAAQSVIAIGWVGVPRSTPDYAALEVMNTILGGSFTSRLNQNLREQHGYAYGAGSAFDMRLSAGPFAARASVQTDKTAESVTEFFNELTGMREPIPAEEVDKARNYVALSYPGQFETTSGIAGQIAELIVYGLADDTLARFVSRVMAVTPADVARVAKTYLQPERFAVVIVGDRQAVEAGIRALGLGPITVLSVQDVVR